MIKNSAIFHNAIFVIAMLFSNYAVRANDVRMSEVYGAKKFDIICRMNGEVISNQRKYEIGTYPASAKKWSYTERISIDTENMKYCLINDCARLGPRNIQKIDHSGILFSSDHNFWSFFRFSDREIKERLVDGETVSVTKGLCRMAKFSSSPVAQATRH